MMLQVTGNFLNGGSMSLISLDFLRELSSQKMPGPAWLVLIAPYGEG